MAEFIVYTEDLVSMTDNVPPVSPHFYADDTNLLMSSSHDGVTTVCRALEKCVRDVQVWCSSRRLQLNPAKTKLIWFGSQFNLERISNSDISVRVSGLTSRILTCTELKGHCFVLVSGYVC